MGFINLVFDAGQAADFLERVNQRTFEDLDEYGNIGPVLAGQIAHAAEEAARAILVRDGWTIAE